MSQQSVGAAAYGTTTGRWFERVKVLHKNVGAAACAGSTRRFVGRVQVLRRMQNRADRLHNCTC